MNSQNLNYQTQTRNPNIQTNLKKFNSLNNSKLIFWLKFEGSISHITGGLCILSAIISIISIIGIFSTLPFIATTGIYYLHRATHHYQIANALESNSNQSNILDDLRSVYKWSGVINVTGLIVIIISILAIFLSNPNLINSFNLTKDGFNSKPNSAICTKASYSAECAYIK